MPSHVDRSRRSTGAYVIAFVVVANVLAWAAFNRSTDEMPWTGTIRGLSYSPIDYRESEGPEDQNPPPRDAMAEDLRVAASATGSIRTYSSAGGLAEIAPLAARQGLAITVGAWIGKDPDQNEEEVRSVAELARANSNVKRIIVGNEALLRKDATVGELRAYIKQVRARTSVPISTAEPWGTWLAHRELADDVDFITVHILPYWEDVDVDDAVTYVLEKYAEVQRAFPGKPIVIGEVGWPSQGRQLGRSFPGLANQARFTRQFLNVAAAKQLDYYLVEAFDQPWKRGLEGTVGAYWGLFNADREAKFPMVGPISPMPEWPRLCGLASLLALIPMVVFVRRQRHLGWPGVLLVVGSLQIASSLLVGIAHTGIAQYATTASSVSWALLFLGQLLLFIMFFGDIVQVAELLWRKRWSRRFVPVELDRAAREPKVSLHLCIYNEPPAMVKQTLDSLARLDYSNFEVIVVDNNTKDPEVWRPIEAWCARLGPRFRFFHLDSCPGFKAGALNFAREQMAADAEIVGMIDSDYLVNADWLRKLVPFFDKPEVGFVQAPQDHREWQDDAFKQMINWEYAGFFHLGMVHRNESDAIIQHGTMSLMRRTALDLAGAWGEWCICEDAEMGLRLLEAGFQSVYVNETFGTGLTPDSFTGYKKQRFRWAFGAIMILKRYGWALLAGRVNNLSLAQRYHFIAGWLPWIADALSLLFAVVAIGWTAGMLASPLTLELPVVLFMVPSLGVCSFKLAQTLWMYAARVPCTRAQRWWAAIAGLSLSYTVGKAVWKGIFTSRQAFLRTPKCEDTPALMRGFLMAAEELALTVLLWGAAALSLSIPHDTHSGTGNVVWAIFLFAQSLPYAAAVATSFVNVLSGTRAPARAVEPAALSALWPTHSGAKRSVALTSAQSVAPAALSTRWPAYTAATSALESAPE